MAPAAFARSAVKPDFPALSGRVDLVPTSFGPQSTVWVLAAADGRVSRSSGLVGLIRLGVGRYEARFRQDVSECAYTASVGDTGNRLVYNPGLVFTAGGHISPNGVYVETKNLSGGLSDFPFHLVVRCSGPRTIRGCLLRWVLEPQHLRPMQNASDSRRSASDTHSLPVLAAVMKTKGVGILTYQADRDNLRRDAGDWHEGVRTAAGSPPANLRTKGPAVTTKSDFSEEEWSRIVRAPFVAGLAISLADPGGPIEAAKESMATVKSATNPSSQEQLVTEVALDIQAEVQQKRNPLRGYRPSLEGTAPSGEQVLVELSAVQAIVAAQATPEETAAFGQWLVASAQAAANAAKEGGFMGFGAAQVSKGEGEMLDQVRAAVSQV